MRKPDKAPLRNVLLSEKATIHSEKTKGKYVLDGGALLVERYEIQRISEAYVRYIRKNYGNAYIVFNGYDEVIQQNQMHMH